MTPTQENCLVASCIISVLAAILSIVNHFRIIFWVAYTRQKFANRGILEELKRKYGTK